MLRRKLLSNCGALVAAFSGVLFAGSNKQENVAYEPTTFAELTEASKQPKKNYYEVPVRTFGYGFGNGNHFSDFPHYTGNGKNFIKVDGIMVDKFGKICTLVVSD